MKKIFTFLSRVFLVSFGILLATSRPYLSLWTHVDWPSYVLPVIAIFCLFVESEFKELAKLLEQEGKFLARARTCNTLSTIFLIVAAYSLGGIVRFYLYHWSWLAILSIMLLAVIFSWLFKKAANGYNPTVTQGPQQ